MIILSSKVNNIYNGVELTQHPPILNSRWIVKIYHYQTWYRSQEIEMFQDISDNVIDVSYECDSSNNIKQSASIVIHVDESMPYYWYMRKEHEIVLGEDDGTGSSSWIVQWENSLYHISQSFTTTEGTRIRDYGFFIPDSNSEVYNSTAGTVTLQLKGMSAGLTKEFGGTIITALRSNDYRFYDDGKFGTKIDHYEIPEHSAVNLEQITTSNADKVNASGVKEKEKAKTSYTTKDKSMLTQKSQQSGQVVYTKKVVSPYTVSLPNTLDDGKSLIVYEYDFLAGLFDYTHTREYCNWILNTWLYPIKGFQFTSQMDIHTLPHSLEFDIGVSFSDIFDKFLETVLKGYMYWVDENRRLCVDYKPRNRGDHPCGLDWKDYGDLFIEESISYSEGEYFSATQVLGKDSLYYGFIDNAVVTSENANIDWDTGMIVMPIDVTGESKVQTMVDNDIESNQEALMRAQFESRKSMMGHEVVTAKIRNDWINGFVNPSLVVGFPIEYRTIAGQTSMMILDKASLSNDVWTFTMHFFHDQNVTEQSRERSLAAPTSITTTVHNNIGTIYISGGDSGAAEICRIYVTNQNNSGVSGEFFGETARKQSGFVFEFELDESVSYQLSAAYYAKDRDERYISPREYHSFQVHIPERPQDPYLNRKKPQEQIQTQQDEAQRLTDETTYASYTHTGLVTAKEATTKQNMDAQLLAIKNALITEREHISDPVEIEYINYIISRIDNIMSYTNVNSERNALNKFKVELSNDIYNKDGEIAILNAEVQDMLDFNQTIDDMAAITWEHNPYILVGFNTILTDENDNRLTI